jgi:hypothetical protein
MSKKRQQKSGENRQPKKDRSLSPGQVEMYRELAKMDRSAWNSSKRKNPSMDVKKVK